MIKSAHTHDLYWPWPCHRLWWSLSLSIKKLSRVIVSIYHTSSDTIPPAVMLLKPNAQVHADRRSHTPPCPTFATQWPSNRACHSGLWAGLSCESDLYLLRALKPRLKHTKGNCRFIRATGVNVWNVFVLCWGKCSLAWGSVLRS